MIETVTVKARLQYRSNLLDADLRITKFGGDVMAGANALDESESTGALCDKLDEFSRTGHVIPVDRGLPGAFLR